MNLRELQGRLVDAVETGCRDATLLDALSAARGVPAGTRLEQYRAIRLGTRASALANGYPVTKAVLGRRCWQRLIAALRIQSRPSCADLNRYGEWLPESLASSGLFPDMPWLADLARLERSVRKARLAGDDPPFAWQALQALTATQQQRVRLQPSAALTVATAAWPVDDIWHAWEEQRMPSAIGSGAIAYAVHRAGAFEVRVERLAEWQLTLLQRVMEGEVLEHLDAEGIPIIFNWIQAGWFVGFGLA